MRSTMEADVLPRVAAGDPAAVQSCIDRYGGLVWSLARRYLGASREAEDAVADSFAVAAINGLKYDRHQEELNVNTFVNALRGAIDEFHRDPLGPPLATMTQFNDFSDFLAPVFLAANFLEERSH